MKRTAYALSAYLGSVVGLEGLFLIVGTILLAIGSSYVSPVGPWLVVGGMCVLAGFALAVPQRTR